MADDPLQSLAERTTVELTYAPPPQTWRRWLTSSIRSWARSTFSRESYISSLKSLLWVLPLTALIWVYAEREQVMTLNNVIIKVKSAEDSGRVLRIIPASDTIIHADLKGPQADIDQAKEYIENTAIPIEVDRTLAAGEYDVDVTSLINKLPEVVNRGVTVTNCIPSVVHVSIDPIIEKEVEVKPPADFAGTPAVFTPTQVRIRGPASQLDRAMKSGQLFAYADFRRFSAQLAAGGSQVLQNVPLSPPSDVNASETTFSPVVVRAQVEAPRLEKRALLSYVTVFAAYPEVPRADQYRAKFDNRVLGIHIVGPADEVAKLESGATTALAIFRVDLDNTDTTAQRTAPLIFDLPPGVRVADQDKNQKITYTLEQRPKADQ
jgi:hypothetical protein